jgi:kinesin family protein C2/C3
LRCIRYFCNFCSFQIACLKAALAKKGGESENIRSTQSSPNIYKISRGNATPVFHKNRQPMEEVGNIEVTLLQPMSTPYLVHCKVNFKNNM